MATCPHRKEDLTLAKASLSGTRANPTSAPRSGSGKRFKDKLSWHRYCVLLDAGSAIVYADGYSRAARLTYGASKWLHKRNSNPYFSDCAATVH